LWILSCWYSLATIIEITVFILAESLYSKRFIV
jgi:hypothetical protein